MVKRLSIDNLNIDFYDLKSYENQLSGGFLFKKKLTEQTVKYTYDNNEYIPENRIMCHVYSQNRNVVNDFKVTVYKETGMCCSSNARGFGFIIPEFRVLCDVNFMDVRRKLDMLAEVFDKADCLWKPETQDEVDSGKYIELVSDVLLKKKTEEIKQRSIEAKRESKRTAKKLNRYKYRIGDLYSLRYRTLSGDRISDDIYQIRKVIYSIGSTIVNILIMKKIQGSYDSDVSRNQLSVNDCRNFHIKYEPGLLVFNMNERFYKVNKDIKQLKDERH